MRTRRSLCSAWLAGLVWAACAGALAQPRPGPTVPGPGFPVPAPPLPPAAGPGSPGWTPPAAPAPAPPALPPAREDEVEPGELLVAWRSAAEADAGIAEIAQRHGRLPTERFALAALGRVVALYRLPGHDDASALRERLARERPAWLVDYNTLYFASAAPRQYAAAQIDLPPAAADARLPRIGLLDTAVDASPALAGSAIVRRRFVPDTVATAPAGHGTAVATLVVGHDAATGFEGAARGATLVAGEVMRFAPDRAHAATRHLLPALDWLLAEAVAVVNLSFGGAPNRLLADALDTTLRRAVVVAAAGNAGPDAPPAYPAAQRGVIAVTAVDASGAAFERANRGAHVALSAPGVDVWVPDGDGGRYVTGTSFAAAWVSGAAARLRAALPALPPADAESLLCAAARDLGAAGRDPVFGCGLLQVQPALHRAGAR